MKLRTRMAVSTGVVLLLVLCGAFAFIFRTQQAQTQSLYQAQAKGVAYTVKLFGRTMSKYGGVFAKETDQVKLNPYLAKVPGLPSKMKNAKGADFVLVNPFEIVQGMSELSAQDKTAPFTFRVPSDKALNPMNSASPEETAVLNKMRQGKLEAVAGKSKDKNGNKTFVLNAALATDPPCMTCHMDYSPGRVEGMLSVTLPIAAAEAAQTKNMQMIIIIFAAVLVLIMAVNYWLASRISSPIKELADAAERISKGESDVMLNINRKDEIGELAQAFNRMSASLKFFMNSDDELPSTGTES